MPWDRRWNLKWSWLYPRTRSHHQLHVWSVLGWVLYIWCTYILQRWLLASSWLAWRTMTAFGHGRSLSVSLARTTHYNTRARALSFLLLSLLLCSRFSSGPFLLTTHEHGFVVLWSTLAYLKIRFTITIDQSQTCNALRMPSLPFLTVAAAACRRAHVNLPKHFYLLLPPLILSFFVLSLSTVALSPLWIKVFFKFLQLSRLVMKQIFTVHSHDIVQIAKSYASNALVPVMQTIVQLSNQLTSMTSCIS